MPRSTFLIIPLLWTLTACGPGAEESASARAEPRDQAECLDRIRAEKMSEVARQGLEMVARHLAGQIEITFAKPEGADAYYPSFRSRTCPVPGLHPDDQAALDRKNQAEILLIMRKLQPLADRDGSGFVATEEGLDLRRVYEFGLKAGAIMAAEGGDPHAVCGSGNVTPAQIDSLMGRYNDFAAKAIVAGVEGVRLVEWSGADASSGAAVACPPDCPFHVGGR